jgi:diguanylate cyclase (GGDEF)-like protein
VSPVAGTSVAIAFPLIAAATALAGTALATETISGSRWILLLVPIVAAYGWISIPTGRRSLYTFGQPTIVLAGFIGGPLVGLLAGVAPNLTEPHGVWRRRAAYAGLDGLQGVFAGFWGLAVANGEVGLDAGLALACVWALMISATGRMITQFTRSSVRAPRLALDTGCELLEFLLVSPLLVLSARQSADHPGLVVLACGSLLAITVAVWMTHRHHTRALWRERLRADTDPLTGALSRSAFHAALAREHTRVLNGDRPAAIFIADLDLLKRINDTHRHVTGDQVLRELVLRLQEQLRPGDLVGRWGGDEFIVLAPGLERLAAAAELGERMRRAVFARNFATDVGELRVTVSIGGTLLDGAATAEEAIDRADQALYRAKGRRNRVVALRPPAAREPAHSARSTVRVGTTY